jgi:hypothetical protein
MAWQLRDMTKVKKRTLALSRCTNQALQSHVVVEDQIIVEIYGKGTFGWKV